jgi:hypothetical protein
LIRFLVHAEKWMEEVHLLHESMIWHENDDMKYDLICTGPFYKYAFLARFVDWLIDRVDRCRPLPLW